MAIRKIARLGHPVLRKKARELASAEIGSAEIERIIQDMVETMHEYGGIGLAAPQIHEPIQLALVEFRANNARYPDMGDQPLTVVINPKITILDPTPQGNWEGCLSVPEMRGWVERPREIRVDFLDVHGRPRTIRAENFFATVLQHELDHLEGILFVDRLETAPGKTPLAFTEEYQRYLLPQNGDREDSDSIDE